MTLNDHEKWPSWSSPVQRRRSTFLYPISKSTASVTTQVIPILNKQVVQLLTAIDVTDGLFTADAYYGASGKLDLTRKLRFHLDRLKWHCLPTNGMHAVEDYGQPLPNVWSTSTRLLCHVVLLCVFPNVLEPFIQTADISQLTSPLIPFLKKRLVCLPKFRW